MSLAAFLLRQSKVVVSDGENSVARNMDSVL